MFHHHSGQGVEPHTLPDFHCGNLQHDSGHSLQVCGSFFGCESRNRTVPRDVKVQKKRWNGLFRYLFQMSTLAMFFAWYVISLAVKTSTTKSGLSTDLKYCSNIGFQYFFLVATSS